MAWALYGLLSSNAPDISLDSLAADLKAFFSRAGELGMEIERDPFDVSRKNLLLKWDNWWVRVFLERGPEVVADSVEIGDRLGTAVRDRIGSIDRRIRVLFADDSEKNYTNHAVFMMDFLGNIPGVVVFDPQRNVLID